MGCNSSTHNASTSDVDAAERIKTMMYRKEKMILSEEEARQIANQLDSMGLNIMDVKKVIFDRDYDKIVQEILKILSGFDLSLNKFQRKLEIIHAALELLPEESKSRNDITNDRNRRKKCNKKINKMLSKLAEFKSADDPFAEFDFDQLKSSCRELQIIMRGLAQKKDEAHELLSSTKRRRKIWSAFYTVIFDLALGVSVVFAGLLAHPVAMAAAAIQSFGPWIDAQWDKRENFLAGVEEAVESMCKVRLQVHEIDTIRALAEKWKGDLDSVNHNVDFALRGHKDKEAIKIAMADIKNKIGDMDEDSKNLMEKVNSCTVELKEAAAAAGFRIIAR